MQRLWLRWTSPAVDRGLYIAAGTRLGYDAEGQPVAVGHALVVVDLSRFADGWILTYRPLRSGSRQASGPLNSRITPVAS